MKRSEMCKIIEEYMNGPRHDATASTLLQLLEDAGMRPPKMWAGNGLCYNDGEWAPEDE